MLGPIIGNGSGFGGGQRLDALRDFFNQFRTPSTSPSQGQALGLTQSSTSPALSTRSVNTEVSQMLQAIGGGVQDDRLLQLLITLVILAALMQESQSSQTAALDLLGALSGRSGFGSGLDRFQSISVTTTQVTFQTQYSINAVNDTANGAQGAEFDVIG